jgi:DinB superfamily
MSPLELATEQIKFARSYTLDVLAGVNDDDWFRPPPGGVTHLAWQVGHLAMAEFRMVLERVRGARPDDADVLPPEYLQIFGRGSEPLAAGVNYPPMDTIRGVFARIHERVLAELQFFSDVQLAVRPLTEHRIANTGLRCLWWCSQHELIHTGQIALIKRQLGYPAIW